MTALELVAHHELGHALMAIEFKHRLDLVSIVPGSHFGGVTIHAAARRPAEMSEREHQGALFARTPVAMPARLRRRFEIDALISLAGPTAEDALLAQETGVVRTKPEPVSEPVEPKVTKQVADRIAAADAGPLDHDTVTATALANLLSPGAGSAYYWWLYAEAGALVRSPGFSRAFELAVPVLLERRIMTGAALKRLLVEGGIR